MSVPWRGVFAPYLPPRLRGCLEGLSEAQAVREVRIRAGQPVEWVMDGGKGGIADYVPAASEVARVGQALLEHSAYAHQQELRQGFVTLKGGHRAGLCGRALVEQGQIIGLRDIASLCLRVSRPVPGAAAFLLPYLAGCTGMLVFSPPGMGKTTLLRDAARLLSDEQGLHVCIADERSEIAACMAGVPQMPVGRLTDVLDGCPKALGMMMLLRAMAPQWLVADEIGGKEDGEALEEAGRCGVPVLCSAHAGSLEALWARPVFARLKAQTVFSHYVLLGPHCRCNGVWDAQGRVLAANQSKEG